MIYGLVASLSIITLGFYVCSKKVEDSPNSVLRRYRFFFKLKLSIFQLSCDLHGLTRRGETHTESNVTTVVVLAAGCFFLSLKFRIVSVWGGVVCRLSAMTNANNKWARVCLSVVCSFFFVRLGRICFLLSENGHMVS